MLLQVARFYSGCHVSTVYVCAPLLIYPFINDLSVLSYLG